MGHNILTTQPRIWFTVVFRSAKAYIWTEGGREGETKGGSEGGYYKGREGGCDMREGEREREGEKGREGRKEVGRVRRREGVRKGITKGGREGVI